MRNQVEMRRKGTFTNYIKAMAHIQGKEIMPDVKLYRPRKARGPDKGPRNLVEKQLREDVVEPWLNKHGWRWWAIENARRGRNTGIADYIIAKHKMIFIETKGTGGLTGRQPEFRDWCRRCGMPYVVVRALEDLEGLEVI